MHFFILKTLYVVVVVVFLCSRLCALPCYHFLFIFSKGNFFFSDGLDDCCIGFRLSIFFFLFYTLFFFPSSRYFVMKIYVAAKLVWAFASQTIFCYFYFVFFFRCSRGHQTHNVNAGEYIWKKRQGNWWLMNFIIKMGRKKRRKKCNWNNLGSPKTNCILWRLLKFSLLFSYVIQLFFSCCDVRRPVWGHSSFNF